MTLAQERDVWTEYQHATGEERERIEEELVREHSGIAYTLARKFRNVDEAEGEAFLGLLMAIRNYDSTSGMAFSTFSWIVVRNKLSRAYRKKENDNQKANYLATSIEFPVREGDNLRLVDVLPEESPRDFDETMELKEVAEVCKLLLRKQPARRVQVLEMRMKGMTYRQIADELGITTSAVGKHVDRLRAAMKDAMKRYEAGQLTLKSLKSEGLL